MRKLILILLATLAGCASAHEIRPAYFKLVQTGPGRFAATFKQPQIQGRFLGLEAVTNCEDLGTPVASVDQSALKEEWEIVCRQQTLERIEIRHLHSTMIDTLVNVVYKDGRIVNHLITPREPLVELNGQTPWLPLYLVMGIEHLLLGFDHLLFIFVLMFVAKGPANLIKAVTSFTVAHSITLGLSAFDIVTVSQAPVEATIALSIVVLSLQALRPGIGNPWGITFIFGLLHGLGFAGALAEIGLPENTALWALLFFNLGIEAGQLAIIALLLTLLFAIDRLRVEVPGWTHAVPLVFAGSVASYWLIQRTAQIIF